MKIALLFPKLPPAFDGIGDYTARLAEALAARAEGYDVTILSAQDEALPLPGVAHRQAMQWQGRTVDFGPLEAALNAVQPDVVVLQYNPFSYGYLGRNPRLVPALRALRRRKPAVRLVVMVHETAVPPTSWRWRLWRLWQVPQLRGVLSLADDVVTAIAAWGPDVQALAPQARVSVAPVGSNMPPASVDRAAARARLGFAPQDFVVGLFGGDHPSKLRGHVRAALDRLAAEGIPFTVLHIGSDGPAVAASLAPHRVRCAGKLDAQDVADHFAALDVYLAPFKRGVSGRRGSFHVGVQQGVATVSTWGSHTDTFLCEADGRACLLTADTDAAAFAKAVCGLATDAPRRQAIAEAGRGFYAQHLAWPVLAGRLVAVLPHQPQPDPLPA